MRGEPDKAVATFEAVLPRIEPRRRVAWLTLRALFASFLNESGQHARAQEVLLQTLSHVREGEEIVVGRHLEALRQLSLAEAGLGQIEQASERLDGLLAQHGEQNQPLLIGLLHKARAEVALLARDREGFERHLAAMEQRFRETRNPGLIAQWERLAERAYREKLLVREEREREAGPGAQSDESLSALSQCRTAHELRTYIVEMVSDRVQAQEVHLFDWYSPKMRLAAANVPQPVPEEWVAELSLKAQSAISEACATDVTVTVGVDETDAPSSQASALGRPYRTFLLSMWEGETLHVVGGLVIKTNPEHIIAVSSNWLTALASVVRSHRGASLRP